MRLCAIFRESTQQISSLRKFGRHVWSQIITILTGQSATGCFSQYSSNHCSGSKTNCYSNPSPSLFEDFQRKNNISDIFASTSQFDVNILSGSNFQTPQQQTISSDFKTPNCLETPVVCAAPKKRRQKGSLMDFFDL